MTDVSLEHVQSLNKELSALSAAGLRFRTGEDSRPLSEVLDQANTSLELRSSLGQSIEEALQESVELPIVYRNAMQSGLLGEDSASVLDCLSNSPQFGEKLRNAVGRSFIQPLILLALAYLGFITLCVYFVPSLTGIYQQLDRVPGWSTQFLQEARASMYLWVPLFPLLMIAAMVLWYRGNNRNRVWVPFSRSYTKSLQHANFSDQLRLLLEQGVPYPQSLRLAGGVSGQTQLATTAKALADAYELGTPLTAEDDLVQCLPPLLRWALTHDLGDQSLPEILRFVANTYRQTAEHRVAFWQTVCPMLLGALLGGAVVFVYGLCLFGPYVGLIKEISH